MTSIPEFVIKVHGDLWIVPPIVHDSCRMCAGARDQETGNGTNSRCGSFDCCGRRGERHHCIAIYPHQAQEYMVRRVTSKLLGEAP